MADELLNAQDLITAKKHDTFHSEVITGKAGGLSTGANIDYATNAVTGQVQKTLPKILDDLDWSYVGLFADGVTFTDKTDFAVDAVGTQWIYTGSLPFSAAAGTVPSEPTYQVVHVKSASAISNSNGGSVQDFIDESNAWEPFYVESFRGTGLTDSETINAALSYINELPYTGTKLIFKSGKTYTYNATSLLGTINNLVIDLNGATLKRANGSTTATTLAEAAGTGQSILYLTSIPDNWKVGDFLTAFSDETNANTSQNAVKITEINRDLNRIAMVSGFGSFGSFTTTLPVGLTIAKNFQCFVGRPSAPDSTTPLPAGINKKIFIINGTIDGNRQNQLNVSWRFMAEIGLHSSNGLITNMDFKEIAGETIVGHGLRVQGNRYNYINGSCFHLSLNDLQIEEISYSHFCDNVMKNVNQISTAITGHSEGAITFSWAAGNLVVSGNICKNGGEGFLGDFGSPLEENPDRLLIVTDNIVENVTRIGRFATDAEGVLIDNNVWSNCGDNSAEVLKLLRNPKCKFGNSNLGINGTTLSNVNNSERSATMSDWKNWNYNIRDYVQKAPIAGTLSYTINDVSLVEDASAALRSFLTSDTGISGFAHYHPSGSNFGSYLDYYQPSTNTYKRYFNGGHGRHEFGRSDVSTQLVLDEDGDVQLKDFAGLYLSDKTQDGTWRFVFSGINLLLQRRVSGSWVTKQTFSGA